MHLSITIGLMSDSQKGWPANKRETDIVIKILLVWFPAAPSRERYVQCTNLVEHDTIIKH